MSQQAPNASSIRVLWAALAACSAIFVASPASSSVFVNGQQTTSCLVNQGGVAALGSCAAELTAGRGPVQSGNSCLTLQRGKPLSFSTCARSDDQDWTLEDGRLRNKSGMCAEAKSNGQVTAEQCNGGPAQRFVRADVADLAQAASRIGMGPAGKAQLGVIDRAASSRAQALGPGGTWIGVGDLGVAALGSGRFLIAPGSAGLVPPKAGNVVGPAGSGTSTAISEDGASITTSQGGSLHLSNDIVAAAGGASAVRTQLADQLGLKTAPPTAVAAAPRAATPAAVANTLTPPAVATAPASRSAVVGGPAVAPSPSAATAPVPDPSAAFARAPDPSAAFARAPTTPATMGTPVAAGSASAPTPATVSVATAPVVYSPIKVGTQCVTVDSPRVGSAVVLSECRGTPNQQFRLAGAQLIANIKYDGRDLCLDAGNGGEGELVTPQMCGNGGSRGGASWTRNGDEFRVSTGRALGVANAKVSVLGSTPAGAVPDDDGPIGQLDAFDSGAKLLSDSLQMVDAADGLAQAMQAAAAAGLLEADVANDAAGAARGARYLLNGSGNPYSLSKLVAGTVVAMDDEERGAFNAMIAADGLDERIQETKAMLLASRWAAERESFALGSTFLERSVAEIPGGAQLYLYRDTRQRITVDGNDRAQTLISILTFGRALNTATTFGGGLSLFEQTASSFVEGATKYLEHAFPKQVGLSPLEEHVLSKRITKFATAYTVAKVTTLLSIAAMNAMAVNTPSSISGVYMNLGSRKYVKNAPPWPLKTGEPNQVTGSVYVIPHTADAQVITPLSIIGTVVDLGALGGAAKFVEKFKTTQTLTKAIDDAMKKAKLTWGIISHTQLDNLLNAASGKNWLPQWAASTQNYFTFKGRDLPPVEMNDTRVVKLTAGPQGAEHISVIPGQKWIVRGVSAGSTGIHGELTPAVEGLYAGGGEKIFHIAIDVSGDQPFVPWAPCGRPGDGGIMSPYTGKCEYPN